MVCKPIRIRHYNSFQGIIRLRSIVFLMEIVSRERRDSNENLAFNKVSLT